MIEKSHWIDVKAIFEYLEKLALFFWLYLKILRTFYLIFTYYLLYDTIEKSFMQLFEKYKLSLSRRKIMIQSISNRNKFFMCDITKKFTIYKLDQYSTRPLKKNVRIPKFSINTITSKKNHQPTQTNPSLKQPTTREPSNIAHPRPMYTPSPSTHCKTILLLCRTFWYAAV